MAFKTESIDAKLSAGIDKLREDRSIPATREKLAELAGCSAGAIAYRTKIVEALQSIKEKRKASKVKPVADSERDLRQEVQELKTQLKEARDQTQVQVNKRKDIERRLDKLQRLYAQLLSQLSEAKEKLSVLGVNLGTVLPFRSANDDG